jgi:HlyD family secretion protein
VVARQEGPEAPVDRPLDAEFRRARTLKRAGVSVAGIGVLLAIFLWGPGWISPSVSRARIRTAHVDAGPIEAVISASGTVLPEIEEVVSSPVDARVLRILVRPGAELKAGQPIVELDTSESSLAVEKLTQNLALKENQQEKTRLDLERSLNDLDSQARIKDLQLQSFRSQLARSQALSAAGLISAEQLRQAELAEAQAVIELKKIQNERENAQRSTRAQLDGLALEMATVRKETQEARRQLGLASPRAGRHGVLTWSLTEEGIAVHKGDVLARIADLSTFRVEATLSDVHAKRVSVGLPVAVKVGEETLEGVVGNVLPTIKNGVMTVQVALRQKSSPLLRSNLRVDAFIVTGRRARALRVKKGPFADGEGPVDAFVVRGDRAYRTRIELGLSSFDDFEVTKGLSAGDEVIISDMKDYVHLAEIRVK